MSEPYQGWGSWETWWIGTWIDNDRGLHEWAHESAAEAWEFALDNPHEILTPSQEARATLEGRLKEFFEDQYPEDVPEPYNTMLDAAMREVKWRELANAYLRDMEDDQYEPI